jgi:hypothetical protein
MNDRTLRVCVDGTSDSLSSTSTFEWTQIGAPPSVTGQWTPNRPCLGQRVHLTNFTATVQFWQSVRNFDIEVAQNLADGGRMVSATVF